MQKYISIHISFCCATQVPMQHAIPNLSKLVFWYWVLYAIIWMFYSLDQNFGSRILVLVICYCKFTTLWKKFLNLYCIQINVGKYSSIVHTEVVLREYDCPSFVAEKKKLMQLLARIFKGAKLFTSSRYHLIQSWYRYTFEFCGKHLEMYNIPNRSNWRLLMWNQLAFDISI